MSIELPAAIQRYLEAENSGQIDSLAECFARGATVRDENRTHRGLAAIARWMSQTREKYRHRVERLGAESKGGRTVVRNRLTGDFPGSPIELDFFFELDGGRIRSLRIGK